VRRINVGAALDIGRPLENPTTNGRVRGLTRQPQAKAAAGRRVWDGATHRSPHVARHGAVSDTSTVPEGAQHERRGGTTDAAAGRDPAGVAETGSASEHNPPLPVPKARVDEVVATSFRLDRDGLRDLDALLRRRNETGVSYEVRRRDTFEFPTTDIEEIAQERNGTETRIVRLRATLKADQLKACLEFTDGVRLQAEGDNRADLLLLIAELRTLVRERFAGRGSDEARRLMRFVVPLLVGALVWVGYMQAQSSSSDARQARWDKRVEAIQAESDRRRAKANKELAQAVNHDAALAPRLVSRGDSKAEMAFLVERQVLVQRQLQNLERTDPSTPNFPEDPWFFDSPLVFMLLAPAAGGLAFLFLKLLLPESQGVFLIGAEIQRQQTLEKRRDRIVWGVVVALVVGVLGSLIAAPFT
jgi:hypothetical protein